MLARGTERRDLLETVQGYVVLKAATFETGHGFALGHNPGAPSPFVTWQFTEGEKSQRDYYWGRYGTSQAWAQRDFDRRVDDYQQLYHAASCGRRQADGMGRTDLRKAADRKADGGL